VNTSNGLRFKSKTTCSKSHVFKGGREEDFHILQMQLNNVGYDNT